ncbi:hypothetical protein GOV14_02170 [Candidatus Pacearchaeota archaeon]|nr:hypothetical protein [Candidatus Pacearchaeota archaeon]
MKRWIQSGLLVGILFSLFNVYSLGLGYIGRNPIVRPVFNSCEYLIQCRGTCRPCFWETPLFALFYGTVIGLAVSYITVRIIRKVKKGRTNVIYNKNLIKKAER